MELSEEQAAEEYVSELIEQGALVLDGWAGDEPTFKIDEERMKEIAPEFYEGMLDEGIKEVEDISISLWQKNMLELDIQDDGSVEFRVTEDGYRNLSDQAQNTSML